jgi:hypothetical protein
VQCYLSQRKGELRSIVPLPPALRKLSRYSSYSSNGISLNLSRRTNRVCPSLRLPERNSALKNI